MNPYAVFQKRSPGLACDDADGVAAKGLLQTLDLVGTPEPLGPGAMTSPHEMMRSRILIDIGQINEQR